MILRCKTEGCDFEIGSLQVLDELEIERLNGSELREQLIRLIQNNLEEIGLEW